MTRSRMTPWVALGCGFVLFVGCTQTFYPDALGVSQERVNEIRNSETLEPQEMRQLLAEYDIDEVTINGLLATVRLANQYGGDLQSAYDKVVDGQMSQMTPDEVQFYGDATDQTTYEDAEAYAIVNFFIDNDIDTIDELTDFLDDHEDLVPDEIDVTNLRSVFITTSTDDVSAKL